MGWYVMIPIGPMALEERFKLITYGFMRDNLKMGNCMGILGLLIASANVINTNAKMEKK